MYTNFLQSIPRQGGMREGTTPPGSPPTRPLLAVNPQTPVRRLATPAAPPKVGRKRPPVASPSPESSTRHRSKIQALLSGTPEPDMTGETPPLPTIAEEEASVLRDDTAATPMAAPSPPEIPGLEETHAPPSTAADTVDPQPLRMLPGLEETYTLPSTAADAVSPQPLRMLHETLASEDTDAPPLTEADTVFPQPPGMLQKILHVACAVNVYNWRTGFEDLGLSPLTEPDDPGISFGSLSFPLPERRRASPFPDTRLPDERTAAKSPGLPLARMTPPIPTKISFSSPSVLSLFYQTVASFSPDPIPSETELPAGFSSPAALSLFYQTVTSFSPSQIPSETDRLVDTGDPIPPETAPFFLSEMDAANVIEEITRVIEAKIAPLNQQLTALTAAQDSDKKHAEDEMAIRAEQLRVWEAAIAKEKEAIVNKTWTRALISMPSTNQELVVKDNLSTHLPRFDPSGLPKFNSKTSNVEQWLAEVQVDIDIFGEHMVVPCIFRNCFPENDVVRSWYTMLGPQLHGFITKSDGCWKRFGTLMLSTWRKPIGVSQMEANERSKLPMETFVEYYFHKLKLLSIAYPNHDEATYIMYIRSKLNDAQADRFVRERSSLTRLVEEMRAYDDHLTMHPTTAARHKPTPFAYPTPPGLALGGVPGSSSTTSSKPSHRLLTSQADTKKYDRKGTVQDRVNPATMKPQRSFVR